MVTAPLFAATALLLVAGGADAGRWPRAASWSEGGTEPGDIQLLLLHTNDMHARFEQTDRNSSTCTDELKKSGQCYGGFARLAHAVREAKKASAKGTGPHAIFLNAGDTYQGTVYYTVHKWRVVAAMLNQLAPDAASLGNHEFDDGVEGLAPFLEEVKFPVVAANVNTSMEPRLAAARLRPTVEIGLPDHHRLGVIGYLTPETRNISLPPPTIIFEDEITAVRREAQKLKANGINIIIALGHSGFDVDQKIAELVEEVDVVIGGHTNTFLFRGPPPDVEKPVNLYPTVVTQKSGKKVPVVQAYAYTKYLGRLTVTFDKDGNLKSFHGNPQLLNSSVPEEKDMLLELEAWATAVGAQTKHVAGRSAVMLEGDSFACRTRECNFGNMLADAYVEYNARRFRLEPGRWTDAPVALQHGGGIRAPIDASTRNGNVTEGDLMTTMPFTNRMFRCDMTGAELKKALEWAVFWYDTRRIVNRGVFLQVSGLKVTYDVTRPADKRTRDVQVRCAECRVPTFEPLNETSMYGVLMPQFIKQGGDGYNVLKNLPQNRCLLLNYTDFDVVLEYLKLRSPVAPSLDGRITFNPPVQSMAEIMKKEEMSGSSTSYSASSLIAISGIFVAALL